MARCIISGCSNQGKHNFGVRLRRPSTRAIWAPNTDAMICDEHATMGLIVTVELEPVDTRRIETRVSSPGGRTKTRRTPIVKRA
jgi:hypothetical protein